MVVVCNSCNAAQGPIDCLDCSLWLLLDLMLVNPRWVHETNFVITLLSHLSELQAKKMEEKVI
jgi:hypothetical protein